MTDRCYKCGRLKCETCGGTAKSYEEVAGHLVQLPLACVDCEDGWRAPERCEVSGQQSSCFYVDPEICSRSNENCEVQGDDDEVLCPECAAIIKLKVTTDLYWRSRWWIEGDEIETESKSEAEALLRMGRVEEVA